MYCFEAKKTLVKPDYREDEREQNSRADHDLEGVICKNE